MISTPILWGITFENPSTNVEEEALKMKMCVQKLSMSLKVVLKITRYFTISISYIGPLISDHRQKLERLKP